MSVNSSWLARSVPKGAALFAVVLLYGAAREPSLPHDERGALASQFRFERIPLEPFEAGPVRVRRVHPRVEHMSAWISAVGAAIALGDLDGDTLPNDYCLVEPRLDRVIVAPVPGTGPRYEPFLLGSLVMGDDPVVAPMGCRFGDLNEDGLTDMLTYYWGRPPLAFLRRAAASGSAPGPEAFRAVDVWPHRSRWNTSALTTADIDGDGHLDLVVGNYFPDGSAPLDPAARDGFALHESMSRAFNGGRTRILLWTAASRGAEPDVRYREAAAPMPDAAARGWTLALGAADLDADMSPEVYLANDFGPDRLLSNRSRPGDVQLVPVEGRRTFTAPTSKVLGRDSFKGMGVDFGDVNDDGIPDLFVSNIANEFALQESNFAWISTGDSGALKRGRAPYVDRSDQLGLAHAGFAWEARLDDFNNDGVLEAMQATGFIRGDVDRWPELQELAMGNNLTIGFPPSWPRFQPGDDLSGHQHNPFFVRASSGRYYDLALEIGIGQTLVSRGIAIADVDGDGNLDFAVANQWDTSHFYRNVSPNTGDSLQLRILLDGSPAVGATATITLPNGRRRVASVDGGAGHSGQRAPELHFGLARLPADTPLTIDVRWRDRHGVVREHRQALQSNIRDRHPRLTISLTTAAGG